MEHRRVVVIGSGPAGTATALYLHRRDPSLAREVLLLDKAEHPREKVCAGGLIPHTLDCLHELDVPLEVPHARVDDAEVIVHGGVVRYAGENLCAVVRRAEFDHSLARACQQRGVEIRGNERVVDVVRENGSWRIATDRGEIRADVVVGADGSGSIVRRKVFGSSSAHTGRAIMCDIPVDSTRWSGFGERRYEFSFAGVPHGLRGYAWAFPCLIQDRPHVNVGVYSVDAAGRHLYDLLRCEAERLGAQLGRVQAFPIHWYRRDSPLACSGALLVGDAAGVDPLMGEGISYCFEYARRAAEALDGAVAGTDFTPYQAGVRASWMGKKLRRLGLATRLFYGPTWRLWFGVASRSRRAQEIGIRWYNGVDGIDRMSVWEALRLLRRLDLPARA